MVDVAVGMALVAVLAAALLATLARQQRASQQLANFRAAARVAEDALSDLQIDRPPRLSAPGRDVQVVRVPADSAPPGRAWVEVRATVGGRSASLLGLVPDGPNLRSLVPATRSADAAPAGSTTRPATAPTTPEAP
jgi:type II secretory pathway pseudopilin PulG